MEQTLPPSFCKPLKNLSTGQGECLVLECRVKGFPTPKITWKREDCIIEDSADFRALHKEGEVATLVINEAFPEDSGVFECQATNDSGTAITSCKVVVKGNDHFSVSTKNPASTSKPKSFVNPAQEKARSQSSIQNHSTHISHCFLIPNKPTAATSKNLENSPVLSETLNPVESSETPIHFLRHQSTLSTYSSEKKSSKSSTSSLTTTERSSQPSASTMNKDRKNFVLGKEQLAFESSKTTSLPFSERQEYKVSSFEQRLINEIEYRLEKIPPVNEDPEDETFEDIPSHQQFNPIFVASLKNYKALEGTSATFTCSVSAKPKAKVYWFKDGKQISKRSRHYIQNSDGKGNYALYIATLTMDDDGNFTAVACNPQGRVSSTGRLAVYSDKSLTKSGQASFTNTTSVTRLKEKGQLASDEESAVEKYYRPTFQQIPAVETKTEEGKLVRFDVKVSGLPAPEIEWKINGKPVIQDSLHKIVVRENNVHSLLLERVSPMDEGQYTITASNKAGSTTTHIQLKVSRREYMSAPAFIERLAGKCVAEGDSIRLEARVVGTPHPTISWKKGSDQVTSNNRVHLFEGDLGYVCLQIVQARLEDADWYTCSATNPAGISFSNCKLDVYSPVTNTPVSRVRIKTPNRYRNLAKASGLGMGAFSPDPQTHAFLQESDDL